IAERKDVLCGLFWMLTMWMYVRYAETNDRVARRKFYVLTLGCFVLGLLSKPMIVTLPFVLLLIDYWPLRRIERVSLRQSILEKVPMFALSIASSIVTVLVQSHARPTFEALPLGPRLLNAVVSYQRYLRKLFWPGDLAVLYPHPVTWPWLYVVVSVLIIGVVSWFVVRRARKAPYLAVGWFWFLGVLVPVSGVLQAGLQSMADRYSYFPEIGLAIALVWGGADMLERFRVGRVLGGCIAAIGLIACCVATSFQIAYWQDSFVLFTHAIEKTSNNVIAHVNRGYELACRERYLDSIIDFESALRIKPDDPGALANIGSAYAKLGDKVKAVENYQKCLTVNPTHFGAINGIGRLLEEAGHYDEAIPYFERALAIKANCAEAENNWGFALAHKRDITNALAHYEQALRIDPKSVEAHNNLGVAMEGLDRMSEAMAHFARAVDLKPIDAQAQNNYANMLAGANRLDEAIAHYQLALKAKPDYLSARSNLGRILVRQKKWGDAIVQFEAARKLDTNDVDVLESLASAYAENGRFSDAVAVANDALRTCEHSGQADEAQKVRQQLQDYQQRK
ncbi:MAG: tetratricopeptide repeat protein, partial [Limisphaerales bacterium]